MALRRRLRRLVRQMRGDRAGAAQPDIRGPNARTDGWYDNRAGGFSDEGRPRK